MKRKFVAQNNSIMHDIANTAKCKSQQNVLTAKIKYLKIKVYYKM